MATDRNICGRQPLHGDGTSWCVRPERHKGMHVSEENGSFIRVQPRERVTGAYDPARDPETTDPVEKRKGSRRLAPQVGKAGDLPQQGRRARRDRRASYSLGAGGKVVAPFDIASEAARRAELDGASISSTDALLAVLSLVQSAANRVKWYGPGRCRRRKGPPQSAIDALDVALALYAQLAPPARADVDPHAEVIGNHARGLAILARARTVVK